MNNTLSIIKKLIKRVYSPSYNSVQLIDGRLNFYWNNKLRITTDIPEIHTFCNTAYFSILNKRFFSMRYTLKI